MKGFQCRFAVVSNMSCLALLLLFQLFYQTVVFMDEAGLPEESHESLKVSLIIAYAKCDLICENPT